MNSTVTERSGKLFRISGNTFWISLISLRRPLSTRECSSGTINIGFGWITAYWRYHTDLKFISFCWECNASFICRSHHSESASCRQLGLVFLLTMTHLVGNFAMALDLWVDSSSLDGEMNSIDNSLNSLYLVSITDDEMNRFWDTLPRDFGGLV